MMRMGWVDMEGRVLWRMMNIRVLCEGNGVWVWGRLHGHIKGTIFYWTAGSFHLMLNTSYLFAWHSGILPATPKEEFRERVPCYAATHPVFQMR